MCSIHEAGTIELYFYGELDPSGQRQIEAHLRRCSECATVLKELKVIREVLAARPDVSTPPSGDWYAFMERLDRSLPGHASARVAVLEPSARAPRYVAGWLATAALLALVSASVFIASRAGRTTDALDAPATQAPVQAAAAAGELLPVEAGLNSVGLRHLERSKLVVLGLATKPPSAVAEADWAYERELATALLNDTRLYRMAAEERGLTSMAGVMKDLELVLLQASMASESDATALPQIQRLIRKRGLVAKMDVVGTAGLVP